MKIQIGNLYWYIGTALGAALLISSGTAGARQRPMSPAAEIAIPGGSRGIGFDDIQYATALQRVIVPAGQTGDVDLLNPSSGAITVIPGAAPPASKTTTGHDEGTTSAVYGGGYLFASDHNDTRITILDPRTKKVVGKAKLASDSDYVRYVKATHELWVTEPDASQIEIFGVIFKPQPVLTHKAVIHISGGPEALAIDYRRGQAYTNQWSGKTLAISLHTRKITHRWANSCHGARGLALAPASGFLFVACKEGEAVVLDLNHGGHKLASAKTGAGVDIISYNRHLHHLYVPGAKSATMTVLGVSGTGQLHRVAVYRTAKGAHCVTTDRRSKAYVCDPKHGRILVIDDHE